jgi:hypothetical protein
VQSAHAAKTPNRSKSLFSLLNGLRQAVEFARDAGHMTFIIESVKDNRRNIDFRSSADVAVTLARKLVADGFAVSITAPNGQVYSADRLDLFLTGESLNS